MSTAARPTLDEIRDNLSFLDDWEDKYRYVIEIGRGLPPFPEAERTDANKVRGCASQVWLVARHRMSPRGPVLEYIGDSDAHIVRGLVAVILALFSGKTAQDILAIDARGLFDELGLSAHLTAQRSNGLFSMVERIRADARAALAPAHS
jgi:cysteine desulfuration protein SufE